MSASAGPGAPPFLGEVRFRRDGDLLYVERATSVMWFAVHVLEGCAVRPDIGLSYDGTTVTLRATNGLWVWRLTGRSRSHRWGADGEPFDMVEAVWPD